MLHLLWYLVGYIINATVFAYTDKGSFLVYIVTFYFFDCVSYVLNYTMTETLDGYIDQGTLVGYIDEGT